MVTRRCADGGEAGGEVGGEGAVYGGGVARAARTGGEFEMGRWLVGTKKGPESRDSTKAEITIPMCNTDG